MKSTRRKKNPKQGGDWELGRGKQRIKRENKSAVIEVAIKEMVNAEIEKASEELRLGKGRKN